jgi:hypothetical protein
MRAWRWSSRTSRKFFATADAYEGLTALLRRTAAAVPGTLTRGATAAALRRKESAWKTRHLGATGMSVSRLCLGAMMFWQVGHTPITRPVCASSIAASMPVSTSSILEQLLGG